MLLLLVNVSASTCPKGKSSLCTKELKRVQCGPNKCLYNNMCQASQAGFSDSSCCPFNVRSYCPSSYKPVTCWEGKEQKCTYPNFCTAQASGFHRSRCILHSVNDQRTCGRVPWESKFKCMSKPNRNLYCGPKKCEFRNICEAREMGWNKSQCTKNDGCRLPSNKKKCSQKYKPVRCSAAQCKFHNMCMARSAGYTKVDCVKENLKSLVQQ